MEFLIKFRNRTIVKISVFLIKGTACKQLSVIRRREERRQDSVAYPELARTSDEREYGTATIGMHARPEPNEDSSPESLYA